MPLVDGLVSGCQLCNSLIRAKMCSLNPAYWEDLPGTFHGKGTCFSFADGHVEFHKWYTTTGKSATDASAANPQNQWGPGDPKSTDVDWALLHATAWFP
jgi:prepilin-type processing-associated H-X9-DG protein